ncbi:DMT family transporter [Mitsuaria sp. GD03876]|uniref:DMT family transporter n=1 Tax=Mitsuaria sp. GD03876 TaxID=2975399 RepID=UPI00244908D5|nr:DMT family transporter [Mitsuaria sp. GD03876]MDH0864785.1 DMT family transporter [Mitsuaria sp. GD03876]
MSSPASSTVHSSTAAAAAAAATAASASATVSSPGLPSSSHAGGVSQRLREGQALMVGGGLLLGTIGVFVEEAGQDPATTVWFRCVFGLAALLAWGAARGQLGELARLRGRALGAVLAVGALTVLNWGLFFAAIPRCSIAVSTVVFHVQPFWLMAMGAFWLRERVSRAQWIAAAVALAGLALATGIADGLLGEVGAADAAMQLPGYATGVLMCLAGSVSYAAASFIAKVEADRAGSFALSAGQCVVGTLVLLPWPLMHGLPAVGPAWGWLAGLGVLHTGLAYVVLYAGMARLGTGRIAVLQFVYPGTAVLVDWLVYGRALSVAQIAGVGLIAAALWTLRRRA